jgi:hypothetical protein
MVSKYRGEWLGLLYGSLGFFAAFALMFPPSALPARSDKSEDVPSWNSGRSALDPDLYVADLSLSLMDEDDFCSNESPASSNSVPVPLARSKAFEVLVASCGQFRPILCLTRLAPKRSPPVTPLRT